ncbi:MAG TPA: hypothetical protein VHG27_01080 [Xanthobacteraceae bacterium]|nr:hypothetical protein [Xanthobacteraceae bacterium]
MADRSKIDTAQAGFQKLLRDQDGKKAASEYERAAAAVRANTARLRALRLARDAAEGAPAQEAAAPPKKKSAKQPRRPAGSLSGWLKDREGSGHNN